MAVAPVVRLSCALALLEAHLRHVMNHQRKRSDTDRPPSLATPLVTRLLRCGLWTLVATGALSGIVSAVRPSTTVAQQTPRLAEVEPAGLSGVAEMATRDWLLHEGRSSPGSDVTLAVDAVSTIASRQLANDYWAAVVAASVRRADAEAPTVWFLEVGITDRGHGLRPVGHPAIVPPPITLAAVEPMALTLTVPHPDDPIAATADAFLRSLLSGAADPTRYVAPNADIPPMQDAPFTEVRLERIAVVEAEPDATRVRVAISGSTIERIAFDLFYELTLAQRDGRWEVTAMSGAPTASARVREQPSTSVSPESKTSITPAASPGA